MNICRVQRHGVLIEDLQVPIGAVGATHHRAVTASASVGGAAYRRRNKRANKSLPRAEKNTLSPWVGSYTGLVFYKKNPGPNTPKLSHPLPPCRLSKPSTSHWPAQTPGIGPTIFLSVPRLFGAARLARLHWRDLQACRPWPWGNLGAGLGGPSQTNQLALQPGCFSPLPSSLYFTPSLHRPFLQGLVLEHLFVPAFASHGQSTAASIYSNVSNQPHLCCASPAPTSPHLQLSTFFFAQLPHAIATRKPSQWSLRRLLGFPPSRVRHSQLSLPSLPFLPSHRDAISLPFSY